MVTRAVAIDNQAKRVRDSEIHECDTFDREFWLIIFRVNPGMKDYRKVTADKGAQSVL
jgi:hypothetical protein